MPARDAPPTVLLVDDNADLLELAQDLLEMAGMRVVTSPDGRHALQMLELVTVDVVVLDMMMPELDGLGFLREYDRRPAPRAPVVAVSAFSAYLDEARKLGAVFALRKPYEAHQLTAVVQRLVAGDGTRAVASRPMASEDEAARLRAVFELRIDEPATEPGMRRFLDEVASTFDVPIAGISAVTEERQRLVTTCSTAGDDEGGPREDAFCTHAIVARAALVIQDAAENPFFRDNPSVTVRGFRFYAGVPLMAPRGEAVGTLCVLDYKPHSFTHYDLELLGLFARRVLAVLATRDRHNHPDAPAPVYAELQSVDHELDIYGRPLFEDLVVVEASRGLLRAQPTALVVVEAAREDLAGCTSTLRDIIDGGLLGRLDTSRIGIVVRGKRASDAEQLIRGRCDKIVRLASTDLDRYGGATGLALVHLEQALASAGASGPDDR